MKPRKITKLSNADFRTLQWIVEDFEENGSLVTFANFGTVTFTDAVAGYTGGTEGVSGADVMDIEQNGRVLTAVSTSGTNQVVVTHT